MAIIELEEILKDLSPLLHQGTYVFTTVPNLRTIESNEIVACVKENDGMSVVLSKDYADANTYSYDYEAAWITLEVNSSLEAIGLTALVASALAQNHISCNVVAGTMHDHLFVPFQQRNKVIQLLRSLSQESIQK